MADENTVTNDESTEETTTPDSTASNAGKMLSQAEVDRIVQREKRKAAEAARREFEEQAANAALSETERLKADKAAAEKAAADAMSAANQRLINAEARVTALDLGFKPDRIAAALKLADLSDIDVDEAGTVSGDALTAALSSVLTQFPEWKMGAVAATNVGGGTNPAGAGSTKATLEERLEQARESGNVLDMLALKRLMHDAKQQR